MCREASVYALECDINTEKVEMRHLEHVCLRFKPRLTKEMIDFYDEFGKSNAITSE